MANNNESATGVFLNGKAQVIEMLQYMTNSERSKLINNIRVRNPQLAEELLEESLTFEHLSNLSDQDLSIIFPYVKAQVLGIALKGVSRDFQRRLLSLAERNYAEEAFEIMTKAIGDEKNMIKKAQGRIVGVLISLKKRKQIQL